MKYVARTPRATTEQRQYALEILKRTLYSGTGKDFNIESREQNQPLLLQLLMNNVIKYFTGEFTETTENLEFNRIANIFFANLWMLNEVGVFIEEGNFELYSKGENEKENTIVVNDLINKKEIILSKKKYNELVWARWNSYENNNWIEAYMYINELYQLNTAFLVSAIWDSKTELYDYKGNKENTKAELNQQLNPHFPVIFQRSTLNEDNDEGKVPNSIEKMEKELKSDKLLNNSLAYWNWIKDMIGMSASMELKKERKSMSEGEIDLHNTTNFQKIVLRELKTFSTDLNEKFSVNLEFDVSFNEKEEVEDNFENNEEVENGEN